MDSSALVVFMLAVLVGSYVQGVTGFALGMIIIAIVTALRAVDVPTVAAVISVLSFANVTVALHGHYREVDRRLFLGLSAGQIPAIAVGVWLLSALDANARTVLELVLGAFITVSSLSMAIRPRPMESASPAWQSVAAGAAGGIAGGLFAASGPVSGWFCYRQPYPVAVIRATLLACYLVTGATRTLVVGVSGGLTRDVLLLAAIGLPAVAIGTMLARWFPPALSDDVLRRGAFSLLLGIGIWIVASAVYSR